MSSYATPTIFSGFATSIKIVRDLELRYYPLQRYWGKQQGQIKWGITAKQKVLSSPTQKN